MTIATLNKIYAMPRTPHSPELKKRAIELFQKGAEVKAIADSLKLPIRTIYRWVHVYQDTRTITPEAISSDPRFQKLIELQKTTHTEGCAWLDSIDEVVSRHGRIHCDLIEDLSQLLKQLVVGVEISPKTINTLSLALCRHMDSELKAVLLGRQSQVSLGQAMSLMTAHGWMYLKNDTLSEIFDDNS